MKMYDKKRRRPIAEINVVPYVDVMLVLLVIFMITAPLLTEGVKVSLPKTTAEKLAPQEKLPLVVTVDASGKYYLNGAAVDPKEHLTASQLVGHIQKALQTEKNSVAPAVFIKGDKQVDYGHVVQLFALLQQAGIDNVGLVTEPLLTTV